MVFTKRDLKIQPQQLKVSRPYVATETVEFKLYLCNSISQWIITFVLLVPKHANLKVAKESGTVRQRAT